MREREKEDVKTAAADGVVAGRQPIRAQRWAEAGSRTWDCSRSFLVARMWQARIVRPQGAEVATKRSQGQRTGRRARACVRGRNQHGTPSLALIVHLAHPASRNPWPPRCSIDRLKSRVFQIQLPFSQNADMATLAAASSNDARSTSTDTRTPDWG